MLCERCLHKTEFIQFAESLRLQILCLLELLDAGTLAPVALLDMNPGPDGKNAEFATNTTVSKKKTTRSDAVFFAVAQAGKSLAISVIRPVVPVLHCSLSLNQTHGDCRVGPQTLKLVVLVFYNGTIVAMKAAISILAMLQPDLMLLWEALACKKFQAAT